MCTNFPHPEERPLGRVSKDEPYYSWFETREDAPLTMRPLPVFESFRWTI
jgi:hypothetical protein